MKPLYLKDINEKIITPGKFGGFCLLPKINNSSSPKIDILVQKTEKIDENPPRAVLFDIDKFSNLLKEKFKAHLEQSIGKHFIIIIIIILLKVTVLI